MPVEIGLPKQGTGSGIHAIDARLHIAEIGDFPVGTDRDCRTNPGLREESPVQAPREGIQRVHISITTAYVQAVSNNGRWSAGAGGSRKAKRPFHAQLGHLSL